MLVEEGSGAWRVWVENLAAERLLVGVFEFFVRVTAGRDEDGDEKRWGGR